MISSDQPARSKEFEIKKRFSCELTSVIYLITCDACNAAHVGETGCTLRTRMNGHRTAIRNGSDTPVADHFGQYGYQPRVCALSSAPYNTTQRRIVEGQWIARFRKLGSMTVLNRDNGADILYLYPSRLGATQHLART